VPQPRGFHWRILNEGPPSQGHVALFSLLFIVRPQVAFLWSRVTFIQSPITFHTNLIFFRVKSSVDCHVLHVVFLVHEERDLGCERYAPYLLMDSVSLR